MQPSLTNFVSHSLCNPVNAESDGVGCSRLNPKASPWCNRYPAPCRFKAKVNHPVGRTGCPKDNSCGFGVGGSVVVVIDGERGVGGGCIRHVNAGDFRPDIGVGVSCYRRSPGRPGLGELRTGGIHMDFTDYLLLKMAVLCTLAFIAGLFGWLPD